MSVLEFQIAKPSFLTILQNRLSALRPCIDIPIAGVQNENPPAETRYIHSMTFLSTLLNVNPNQKRLQDLYKLTQHNGVQKIQAIWVDRYELTVNMTIGLVYDAHLRQSNAAEPTDVQTMPLSLAFALFTEVTEDGVPRLCLELIPPQDTENADAILNLIEEELTNCISLGLSALDNLTSNETLQVINAGISGSSSGDVVLRFDAHPDRPNVDGYWSKFYLANNENRLNGKSWSLFIDESFLTGPTQQKFAASLAEHSEEFSLDWGPSASWAPIGPIPRMALSAGGEVIDACVGIDLDVEINFSVSFHAMTIAGKSVLRVTADMSHDVGFWEGVACTLLSSHLWPVAGALFVDKASGVSESWGVYLGGFVMAPPVIFTSLTAVLNSDLALGLLPGNDFGEFEKVDDTTYRMDIAFPSTAAGFSNLSLTHTLGDPDGLILLGSMTTVPLTTPTLDTTIVSHFHWTTVNACAGQQIKATAKVLVKTSPMFPDLDVPLQICTVKVIDGTDPLNQFKNISWWNETTTTMEIEVKLTQPVISAYGSKPYDCVLFIATNAGVRIITLNAPEAVEVSPPSEEAELSETVIEWLKYKAKNCWQVQTAWDHLHINYPFDVIDPPPFWKIAVDWSVTVANLQPNDRVRLGLENGRDIAVAHARADGTALLDAFLETPQNDAQPPVFVALNDTRMTQREYLSAKRSLKAARSEPATQLIVTRSLFREQGTVPIQGQFVAMAYNEFDDQQLLTVMGKLRTQTFNVSKPLSSRLVSDRPTGDLMGMTSRGSELALWGEQGVIVQLGGRTHARQQVLKQNVIAYASSSVSRGIGFAMTNRSLSVIDARFEQLSEIHVGFGVGAVSVRDRLIVATSDSIMVFDLANPAEPKRLGSLKLDGIVSITKARVPQIPYGVYVQFADHAGVVLDTQHPDKIIPLIEYSNEHQSRPRYADSLRRGCTLMRVNDARDSVSIYRYLRSVQLHGDEPLASKIWPTIGQSPVARIGN